MSSKISVNITSDDKCVIIQFRPVIDKFKEIELEFIIDLDWNYNIIGIEIIDLKYYLGKNALDSINNIKGETVAKYSYDSDCDAFYLKLSEIRSSDQLSIIGKAVTNAEGRLLALIMDSKEIEAKKGTVGG